MAQVYYIGKWIVLVPFVCFYMVQVMRYFLICVVNVLLTIITLGIYLPWALMKCKSLSLC